MHKAYRNVKGLVMTSPFLLAYLKDSSLIEYAESFLKEDTGIEIECQLKDEGGYWREPKVFDDIPDLVEFKGTGDEQRFRIPKGIKGLVCLWNICAALKKYAKLNLGSGIHYHINFAEAQKMIGYGYENLFISENNDWLMKAIKSWNYKGRYNRMEFTDSKTAVKYHSYHQTIEYRIGEMTFDYELMIKRIIHCQNMTYLLKKNAFALIERQNAKRLENAPRVRRTIEELRNSIRLTRRTESYSGRRYVSSPQVAFASSHTPRIVGRIDLTQTARENIVGMAERHSSLRGTQYSDVGNINTSLSPSERSSSRRHLL